MEDIQELSKLIRQRNQLEIEITTIIGRPAQIGHIGEFIASRIFNITLEESASFKSIDGHFSNGPLKGKSVNIKWYAKLEHILDITPGHLPDYYLVLTGPKSTTMISKGYARPWLIQSVYLFDATALVDQLRRRGIKIGVATSVRKAYWEEAEIYPAQANLLMTLTKDQQNQLALFT